MRGVTRLFILNDQDEKFFGEGPYQLLKQVEETGSLRSAALKLGMAYSKATKLIKNAEKSLGFPITVRTIGGKTGGGSSLTEEAKQFLCRYEAYRKECLLNNEKTFEKYLGNTWMEKKNYGCVIMASGQGKRFGGNKLMENLLGKPVIQYIVEATEGIFSHRVIVTRNEQIKAWCEARELPVVFHNLPSRNDTIRLGLETLEAESEGKLAGCVFCPSDMPLVDKDSLMNMLFEAQNKEDTIARMPYQGELGSPVLFGTDYFTRLKNLPEGKGGSEIIRENKDKLVLVEAKSEYELWDVDTREDFDKVQNKMFELKK